MNKPKIIEKDMPFDWRLITGEYDNKTDTIYIKKGLSPYWKRETYFHEMLHRKIHINQIFEKVEAKANIFEELFCGFVGNILAILNWNYEVK